MSLKLPGVFKYGIWNILDLRKVGLAICVNIHCWRRTTRRRDSLLARHYALLPQFPYSTRSRGVKAV